MPILQGTDGYLKDRKKFRKWRRPKSKKDGSYHPKSNIEKLVKKANDKRFE